VVLVLRDTQRAEQRGLFLLRRIALQQRVDFFARMG
jgi:hypothetical protein